MRDDFFKFPRTPHLWWPLERSPKEDRVLDSESVREFLSAEVVVEEKVDGANIGLSFDGNDGIRVQNRGSWVERGTNSQFHPLWGWISQRKSTLVDILRGTLIVFGEWCFAVHSVRYERLPDWFLGFDVYDIASGKFWSAQRRNDLLKAANIVPVPRLFAGRATLADLQNILRSEQSRVGEGPVEGIYVRRENREWLESRAKLVRPEFLLSITEHWSSRPFQHNTLVTKPVES